PQSPPFYLYCDLCHYATVALPDGVVTNPWHSADRVVFLSGPYLWEARFGGLPCTCM
ncbi:unnamed protein product, partial [Gadus morhua 'NCC']